MQHTARHAAEPAKRPHDLLAGSGQLVRRSAERRLPRCTPKQDQAQLLWNVAEHLQDFLIVHKTPCVSRVGDSIPNQTKPSRRNVTHKHLKRGEKSTFLQVDMTECLMCICWGCEGREALLFFFFFLSSFFLGENANEKRPLEVSLEPRRFCYFQNLRTRNSAGGG